MSVTIYGIKACDTMKKARDWLEAHGVAYAFHDYKTQGIDRDVLKGWAGVVGWEVLLNRSGTTFRKLPEASKIGLVLDIFWGIAFAKTGEQTSEDTGVF